MNSGFSILNPQFLQDRTGSGTSFSKGVEVPHAGQKVNSGFSILNLHLGQNRGVGAGLGFKGATGGYISFISVSTPLIKVESLDIGLTFCAEGGEGSSGMERGSCGGAGCIGTGLRGGASFGGSSVLGFRGGMDCGITEGDITSAIGSLGGAGGFATGGGAALAGEGSGGAALVGEGSGGIVLGGVPCSMTY